MTKMIISALLLGFSSLAFAAPSATHHKAAEQLLEVMKMDVNMERMVANMLEVQIQQQPAMQPFRHVMLQFLNKYLAYSAIKPDFIKIYTDEFSERELRQIIAFYKTPTGQKTINRLPVLMQKGAQIGASRVRDHQDELRVMLEAEAKKIDAQKKAANPGK